VTGRLLISSWMGIEPALVQRDIIATRSSPGLAQSPGAGAVAVAQLCIRPERLLNMFAIWFP
jgi:hypothetical protein